MSARRRNTPASGPKGGSARATPGVFDLAAAIQEKGSVRGLAAALDISPQCIYQWISNKARDLPEVYKYRWSIRGK